MLATFVRKFEMKKELLNRRDILVTQFPVSLLLLIIDYVEIQPFLSSGSSTAKFIVIIVFHTLFMQEITLLENYKQFERKKK